MPRTLTAGTVIRSYSPRARARYRLSIEALLTPTSQAAFQISQRAAAAVSASPKTAVWTSRSISSSRRRLGLVTVTPPFASCNAPRTASNISETLAYFIANGSSCASSSGRNHHFIAGDEGTRALLHSLRMPRYFTLEEATALLPTIRPILEQIISLRARLERTERDMVSQHWKARTNGHADHTSSFGEGQS